MKLGGKCSSSAEPHSTATALASKLIAFTKLLAVVQDLHCGPTRQSCSVRWKSMTVCHTERICGPLGPFAARCEQLRRADVHVHYV
jgi:hypothetical protein